MDSINLLLQMKTNRGQSTNFSKPAIKNTLKSSYEVAVPAKEDTVVLLSQEVKKFLEEKKEAEKKKMQEAMDKLRERSAGIQELEKSNQNTKGQQIDEIKQRVKQLLEMMRQCLLLGDKYGAARIAKEAGQLAKQLKALMAAGKSGGGGENVSIPNIDLSGESAESGAPVESAENINGEEMSASAEAEAAAQAQAPQEDNAGEGKEGEGKEGEGKEGEQSEQAEEVKEERKVNQAANELQAIARKLVEKHENGSQNDAAEKQEIRKIVIMLKAIKSMAKQVLKQKTSPLNNEPEKPHVESYLQTEGGKAIKELEKAIDEVEEELEKSTDAVEEGIGAVGENINAIEVLAS